MRVCVCVCVCRSVCVVVKNKEIQLVFECCGWKF